jgi:polar amino acid transport system substrate-binding protein
MSLIGKAKEKPEQVKLVLHALKTQGLKKTYDLVTNKLNTPVALGYSSCGEVIEVGEDAYEFQVGDRVACAGAGYASHAEVVFIPKNLCARVPEDVNSEEAAFSTLGAIALQGIRNANAHLGEIVAVIGLGLIGLLTVQMLKAAGCVVIALDIDPWAMENAVRCGADYSGNLKSDEAASLIHPMTRGNGADAVIITASTKSNFPVEFAGVISRKKARIVVVGDIGMMIPRRLYYLKELNFRISCSYGPGRYDPGYEEYGIDYPIGYVRWTEKRNMEAFLQLIKERKIDPHKLITHKFKIEEARRAYDLITGKTAEKYIGVLIGYDEAKPVEKTIKMREPESSAAAPIKAGIIGAGNFMQFTLLPILKKREDVELSAVVAAEGYLSQNVALKFGIGRCYSEPASIFSDRNINTVIIATRHHLHATYAIEGLKNNKNVYVEKPLAINEMELKEIIRAHGESKTEIFVGFNRRFASHIVKCKEFFAKRNEPMFIIYRINAGFIPGNHWIQSIQEGGGRIIGEVCHFLDLCQFLCQSNFESIFAQNIGNDPLRENISVTIKFVDDSLATVNYLANGDKSYSKERIEIFCQNSTAVIDDFRKLELIRDGKREVLGGRQDKGHQRQVESWVKSLQENKQIPIPFEESVNTTIATFMVHESLNKGKVIYFDEYRQKFFE